MNACRVVLVRTEIAGNIGAAARVMRNMGVSDLVLVDPVADHLGEQADQLATYHARDILQNARVVSSLEEALADCVVAAGTSARTGGLYRRQTVGTPREIMPVLSADLTRGRVALVFGPEPSGLANDEVVRCHHLIHIPADETYPALNLAQAVAICLYELRVAWLDRQVPPVAEEVVSYADQERMFAVLEDGLDQIRYLRGPGGPALMHAIRHLITRARVSALEVRLLFGLARQMQWVARRANLGTDEEPSS
jgi:tRNA/rRNA methyltransferase